MLTADRTPCINPRCRRTFKRQHQDEETICGKCFRALPVELRSEFKRCWREYRKWGRRITRTSDELKIARMQNTRTYWADGINRSWDRIRSSVITPEKPDGLDAFLEEVGLCQP